MEIGKCEGGHTPAFSVKSAQGVENTWDDLPRTAKERSKSVDVKENRGVKICCGSAVCAKRAVGTAVEGRAARELEGIRPLPFPSVMLQM